MRKASIVAGCAFVLLAARPAAAEFISFGWGQADGYGVTFSVGDPYYSPGPYYTGPYYSDPYAVTAPVYVPVPVVVYPPPPVVFYQPPVIYRSVIIHRPIVEKRVIVRHVVRRPVLVERRVAVKEREVVHKRHPDRSGGHGFGFPPGLRRIEVRD